MNGPGVSTLGGHSLGISKFAKNKGTAMKFINWYADQGEPDPPSREGLAGPGAGGAVRRSGAAAKFGYLKALGDSIRTAKPRPKAVKYGDVTMAIQDAAYAALQGQKDPQTALNELQTKLETLV